MRLRGRNVWLIGASSGIGAALVPRLVAAGARLAISARRESALVTVAQSTQAGHDILVKPLDVTDLAAVRATVGELRQSWGSLDVVIYNAGTWQPTDLREFKAETAIEQIDVNYLGLLRVVDAVLQEMIARREGDIVGVASVSGYAGFPIAAAYSSSKAAAIAFLQSLRIDLKKHGIGVTTVNPGFVDTPLTKKNRFGMPFMISADAAAETIMAGLLAGHDEVHFPMRLSWPLKLLTSLPRSLYEPLARVIMLHERP